MNTTKDYFKQWGISHYLARSGLHVVIFVMIWQTLLALLPLPLRTKNLFLILLIICYALLSWSSVSFERALLMFLLYRIACLLGYASHYIHVITLTTLRTYPQSIASLFFDFQLSFGLPLPLHGLLQGTSPQKSTQTVNP